MKEGRRQPDKVDELLTGRFRWVTVTAAVLVGVGTVLPLLWGTFYGDDARTSVLFGRTLLALTRTSVVDMAVGTQLGIITGLGRLFPLSGYTTFLFYLVDGNAFAYKAFTVALIAVNLVVFRLFVLKVTRSQALGLFAILLPPLVFQVRYADDPLTSYHGLLQLIVLYTLLALIALVAYVDTRKTWYLVAGVAAYAASLLTYEVGLPMFVMFFLVAYLYPQRRSALDAARLTWPFAAAAVLIAAVTIGIRLYYHLPVTGGAAGGPYTPNLDLVTAARTLFIQTTGAIPLSYYATWVFRESWQIPFQALVKPMPGFLGTFTTSPLAAIGLAAGYGVLLTGACVSAVRERFDKKDPAPSPWALVAFGACMVVLPGVLISLSPKYQEARWIRWGVAYLPVYASYFGVAALLAVGLYVLLRRTKGSSAWKVVACVAVAVAVFAGVANYGNTASVMAGWETFYVFPRQAEQNALIHGVMRGFPEGGALVSKGLDWEVDPRYFLRYAGKNVAVLSSFGAATDQVRSYASSSAASGAGTRYTFGPGRPLYGLDYNGTSARNGYAAFGPIDSFVVAPDGSVSDVAFQPTRVYLSWDPPGAASQTAAQYDSPSKLGLDPAQWVLESSGDTWALYRAAAPSARP
jgi:hypothetical protein